MSIINRNKERKFRKFNTREELAKKNMKDYKERVKKANKESKENLKELIVHLSTLDKPLSTIEITCLEDYFNNKVEFETNKIHIIRGCNGQGKSTLLKNIANSTSLGVLDVLKQRMKVASNCKEVSNALNHTLEFSPFKEAETFFTNRINKDLSNVKNNITIYIDFTVSFFREEGFDSFSNIIEEVDKKSNGERKIKCINDMINLLKVFLEVKQEDMENGCNILIILDEPESGLSLEIQEEFKNKLKSLLKRFKKNEKMTLTFCLASHSYIWQKDKDVSISYVKDYKNEIGIKKEYKKVFV